MKVFKVSSVDEFFILIARELLKHGVVRETRGTKSLELENPVIMELTDTTKSRCQLFSRRMSSEYLEAELNWYESGSLWVEDIAQASSFWKKLADSNGTVNSNYGFLTKVEKYSGMSQFEWCIKRLREDPLTRQAVMNYNQPKHKYPGNKDFVCCMFQQFMVRDGKLDSEVFMRSNDLIYGFSYDVPWFCKVMAEIAEQAGFAEQMGVYRHYASSLHVYKKHWKMLEEIAAEELPC